MPISVTGTSTASEHWHQVMRGIPAASGCSRRHSAGFTLIELMVVALIIGITLTYVVVTFNRNVDEDVQTEAQRLGALITLAAQESVLHSSQHALEFGLDSYKFLILNEGQWQAPADDDMLRERELPQGISLELYLEGHEFSFEDEATAEDEEGEVQSVGPRAFMLSSGEMSPFEVELWHEDGEARFVVKAGITGKVERNRLDRDSVVRARGFTLLEVMVALAVIAFGLGAVITEASRNISNASLLQDKTLAHWVATNKVIEKQVANAWPSAGEEKGDVEMAGREWFWTVKVIDTLDERVKRMDVEVRTDADSERPVAKVISYLGQPT